LFTAVLLYAQGATMRFTKSLGMGAESVLKNPAKITRSALELAVCANGIDMALPQCIEAKSAP
jgi:hypothetical protein